MHKRQRDREAPYPLFSSQMDVMCMTHYNNNTQRSLPPPAPGYDPDRRVVGSDARVLHKGTSETNLAGRGRAEL